MEGKNFSRSHYCITADPLLVNLKEETPGVILSNVDLVTPVYSLVPTIKFEPEPKNTLEEGFDSEIVNTDINGCESSFSDTDGIETENGFIETILSQGTASRGIACPRVTNNLIPDFDENESVLDVKFQSLHELDAGENEYSDLKLSTNKNLTSGLKSCRDKALFKVQGYPTLNVPEVNIVTAESILDKEPSRATNTKTEPSLKHNPYIRLVDIFAKPLGATAPSKTIIENCDASLLPSASEMIVGNCDLPLLHDKNSLKPSTPGRLEQSRKRKATNGSANSKRVTSQSHDLVKKKYTEQQLKKVVKKQPVTKSRATFTGNEQTSEMLQENAKIFHLPAPRLTSQRKSIGLPFKSPSKDSNILRSLNAIPGLPIPNTYIHTTGNSLTHAELSPRVIVSRLTQADEHSLRKPIRNTESKNITVDASLTLDSSVQTKERDNAPENIATKNVSPSLNDEETLSASNDVSHESNLIADAPVEAAEGSKVLENIAPEKNTPPNVNDKKTLSASNDVPKSTLVNKEQLEERNESVGPDVLDKAAKNFAPSNSFVFPINGEDACVKKLTSVFKPLLKKAKSPKGSRNLGEATGNSAINCTSSTSSKMTSLTAGGNPKPIAISIKQWKNTQERLILPRKPKDKGWQKYTIFANQKMTLKTVKNFSSEGKPYKEQLYFITGKGWACEKCEEIFRKSCHLQNHKKWCHVDLITCSHCPRTYETLGHFRAHLRFCQNPVHKCPECPQIFNNERSYDYHYSHYHYEAYICGDCAPPRNFKNKTSLKKHIYKSHQTKSYFVTCNACGKALRPKSIKKHMRSHERKNLVCIHCGLHFFAGESLRMHWKTHNDIGNPAAIMCTFCGKFFALKTELVKHLKEHESERSFICEHCGKGFFKVFHLDTHLLSHKEKQFICPKCKRGFVLKHQLAAHLRTIACGGDNALIFSKIKKVVKSDKKKPRSVPKQQFTCANCDNGFSSKRQLIVHLSTVLCSKNASSTPKEVDNVGRKKEVTAKLSPSPKNQFTCANCNETFLRKHLLVVHFRSGPCNGGALTVLNKRNNDIVASKKKKEGLRVKSEIQLVCANCGTSFGHKHHLITHLNAGVCGGDVMSSRRELVETKSEDGKIFDETGKSDKHFITVFENFVHKRQLVKSVPCGKDKVSSIEKPIIRKNMSQEKTEKSKLIRKNQFSCVKCGQCFIYKRQLTAHLSSGFCSSSAMSSAKSSETVMKKRIKKQKLRLTPINQFTCRKCSQNFVCKRQLAAHLRSAVCSGDFIFSQKKYRNKVNIKKDKKKSKSAPGVQFICANCNQGFIHKCKLVAHLGVGSCMSSAPNFSEKTKEEDRPEEKATALLSKNQVYREDCDEVFFHGAGAHPRGFRNNVSRSSKQAKEAAAVNMNEEKELMAVLPEKKFVCGSCDNAFVDKQRLNDHLCPAACCSHTLSSLVEAKNTAGVENMKKIESTSIPRRRSSRMRDATYDQPFPRSCRSTASSSLKEQTEEVSQGKRSIAKVEKKKEIVSVSIRKRQSVRTKNKVHERFPRSSRSATKSSLKEQTKVVSAKEDERKILRSMSAAKQFVCRNSDQHFTFKRQLSSHMCTRALHVLKK